MRIIQGRVARPAWLAVTALVLLAPAVVAAETLSLTLDEAVGIALESNRTLGAAVASEDAARARLAQANAAFLPGISASASYTRLDEVPYMDASAFGMDKITMGDDDIYTIGLQVQQVLFTGGTLLNARSAASHGLRAAEAQTRRTGDETRFLVTQAYVNLLQAKAALAVAEDGWEQMRSHLNDLEAMFEEGMIIESDIMRARVQAAEVELQLNTTEHMVQLAAAALAFQMGIDPGTEIEAVDDLAPEIESDRPLDQWIERALLERPDLLAVSEAVEAAGNAVAIARAEYFPQLVFVGNYAWDRPNRSYEPEFYDHWSATLALEMNIFDWLGRENRVREANAVRREADHGRAMMEDAVRLEIRQSYLELDEAWTAVSIAERGVSQARESLRVTRESFRSGVASNSDVLDAQTALTTADMNRIAALARLRVAQANLRLATGVMNG